MRTVTYIRADELREGDKIFIDEEQMKTFCYPVGKTVAVQRDAARIRGFHCESIGVFRFFYGDYAVRVGASTEFQLLARRDDTEKKTP